MEGGVKEYDTFATSSCNELLEEKYVACREEEEIPVANSIAYAVHSILSAIVLFAAALVSRWPSHNKPRFKWLEI